MPSLKQQLQAWIRQYKLEMDSSEVEMRDVAVWMAQKGWRLPKPVEPIDRLAKELAKAARDEMRYDAKTGRPYRANHAVAHSRGGKQLSLWIDIDEAPRKLMHRSLIQRREQMVGDAVQLTFDADHWNSIHPDEEPIVLELDFKEDVEWRKNSEFDEQSDAA